MTNATPPERPPGLLEWLGVTDAPNWRVARPLGIALSVVISILFVLAIAAAFMLIIRSLSHGPTDTGLGAGSLIVAPLGAPFLIWTTALKHQTVRFQNEGHMTDHINKAVEQLGAEKTVKLLRIVDGTGTTVEEISPKLEVRFGAILSLERIAQDSTNHDKGRDHVRVMEILCAYVRENAPASGAKKTLRDWWEEARKTWDDHPDRFEVAFCKAHSIREQDLTDIISVDSANREVDNFPKPRADVALTLSVLGRRTADQRRAEATWPDPPNRTTVWPFDLPCPELPMPDQDEPLNPEIQMDFRNRLDLWKAELSNYRGYRLDLSRTNLQQAVMSSKRSDASDAVFAGASLVDARMEGTFWGGDVCKGQI